MKSIRIETAPKIQPVKGIKMAILGSGDRMTLIRILAQPGSTLAEHSHPHEQIGTCLEGEAELVVGRERLKVEPGVSWAISGGEPHSFVVRGTRPVVIYECWSPPREDYLAMAK